MISTRGRYALRVMVDLSEHTEQGFIPMKDVAKRQELSLKYLERIMPVLVKSRLVEGIQGKGGGYRLTKSPEKYTVGEILRLTEGTLAPVACLERDALPCKRREKCRTLAVWSGFFELTNRYFDGITVADLSKNISG